MSARIRLLSKPGCHLCDDARAVVEAVCADTGEAYDEVDITTDPELMEQYAEQIPVTFVDGRAARLLARRPGAAARGTQLSSARPRWSWASRTPGRVKKNPPPNGRVYSSSGSPLMRSCTARKESSVFW